MTELHYQSAKDLARMIREKSVSVTEVMQAHLARIKATNPQVNAICTLLPEDDLLAQAAEKDAQLWYERVKSSRGSVNPFTDDKP